MGQMLVVEATWRMPTWHDAGIFTCHRHRITSVRIQASCNESDAQAKSCRKPMRFSVMRED
eukprot:scaffold28540_cov27-Tisochrysis_lutea.AAC.2